MCSAATIAAIRAGHGIVLGTHKMFAAGTAMPTAAENADVVYEIFFHCSKGKGFAIV